MITGGGAQQQVSLSILCAHCCCHAFSRGDIQWNFNAVKNGLVALMWLNAVSGCDESFFLCEMTDVPLYYSRKVIQVGLYLFQEF